MAVQELLNRKVSRRDFEKLAVPVGAQLLIPKLRLFQPTSRQELRPQERQALYNNGQALIPPMGWNTWYAFGVNYTEEDIMQTADALVELGMRDAGYQYIVIDDPIFSQRIKGVLVADTDRFPRGIPALADYLHQRGFKFGIYTDIGKETCMGRPGSQGNEEVDVMTFRQFGVDYLKVDICDADDLYAPDQYKLFSDAILQYAPNILLDICCQGKSSPYSWAPYIGNAYRTSEDIGLYPADGSGLQLRWEWIIRNRDANTQYPNLVGPGSEPNPDDIQIGNGDFSDAENRTIFAMWAMMAGPMISGTDVRTLSPANRDLLIHPEIIGINQDPLVQQAVQLNQKSSPGEVWVKPMSDGSTAILLFNSGDKRQKLSVNWEALGVQGSGAVRNMWNPDHIEFPQKEYSVSLDSHDSDVIRVNFAQKTSRSFSMSKSTRRRRLAA